MVAFSEGIRVETETHAVVEKRGGCRQDYGIAFLCSVADLNLMNLLACGAHQLSVLKNEHREKQVATTRGGSKSNLDL